MANYIARPAVLQVRGLSRQSGLLLLSPQWILFEPEEEELPNMEEELAPSGFTSWARDGEPDASEVRSPRRRPCVCGRSDDLW